MRRGRSTPRLPYRHPVHVASFDEATIGDRMTLEHAADQTDVEKAQNDAPLQGNRELLARIEVVERQILDVGEKVLARLPTASD